MGSRKAHDLSNHSCTILGTSSEDKPASNCTSWAIHTGRRPLTREFSLGGRCRCFPSRGQNFGGFAHYFGNSAIPAGEEGGEALFVRAAAAALARFAPA